MKYKDIHHQIRLNLFSIENAICCKKVNTESIQLCITNIEELLRKIPYEITQLQDALHDLKREIKRDK